VRLELEFPAEWNRIDAVREAVSRSLGAAYGQDEVRDALAMVSAELLENAVKYGLPHSVQFSLREEADRIVVDVANQIAGDSAHLEALRQRLAWVHSFPSAEQAYLAALSEIYEKDPQEAQDHSGLGLVRVIFEGGCELACDLSNTGEVRIRATCRRPGSAETVR
jgi:hypothetical protein